MELSGRVAVVTGAASGIGNGIAVRLAAEQMKVVLADVEAGPLEVAAEGIRADGGEAIGVVTDVSSLESVQALADRTIETFGAAHLVCNNAGVMTGAPFTEFVPRTFEWIMDVNFWGVVNGCRVFLPLLRQQDEATIVNTSSTVTAVGHLQIGTAYVASKFAVSGFTETLHRELEAAGENVHVAMLIPGPTDTRIPDAERNLPTGVPSLEGNATRQRIVEALRGGGSQGLMPPSEVADVLVEGLRAGRFHIMTHPDATIDAFQARIDWMRTGIDPPSSPVLEPQGLD